MNGFCVKFKLNSFQYLHSCSATTEEFDGEKRKPISWNGIDEEKKMKIATINEISLCLTRFL